MMEIISEELVEETWQEVAGFDSGHGAREMRKVCENQPDLLAFMLEFTQDLDQDVKELAFYMFYSVYRMFQKGYKKRIKEIPAEEIIQHYERNEDFIASLEGVHQRIHERIAKVQLSSQPYVMKYILDTLFEMPDEEDPIELTEDDKGYLFLIFKTVTELLNNATDK